MPIYIYIYLFFTHGPHWQCWNPWPRLTRTTSFCGYLALNSLQPCPALHSSLLAIAAHPEVLPSPQGFKSLHNKPDEKTLNLCVHASMGMYMQAHVWRGEALSCWPVGPTPCCPGPPQERGRAGTLTCRLCLRNEAGRMEVQHLFKILLIYTVIANRLFQEHWFVYRHLDFCTPFTPSLY